MSKNTIPTRYKEYLDSEDWKKLKSKIITRDEMIDIIIGGAA